MPLGEADTRAKLIDPALHARGWHEDAAIRAALEKIAAGGNRVLLALATGSGKTVLVCEMLHKLAAAGEVRTRPCPPRRCKPSTGTRPTAAA